MPKNRKTYARKVASDKRTTTRLDQTVQANDSSQTFSFSFLPQTKTKTEEKQDAYTHVISDLRKTAFLTGVLILCESILWIVMNLRK
jgi:hypothetical protein